MYTYDRNIVLLAYRVEHPDSLEPSERTLEQFDADLRALYQSEIDVQAPGAGISASQFAHSMLVICAVISPAKRASTRVGHACRYYSAVQPVTPPRLPPVPQGGVQPQPPIV